MENCMTITGLQALEQAYLVRTDSADIQLYFVSDEVIRVRVSFDRVFPEASYVLALTAWEDRLDGLFSGERKRVKPLLPPAEETEKTLVFRTAALRLELDRSPFCLRLYDAEGTELLAGIPDRTFQRDPNGRVRHYSRMKEDDCFYGFGENTGRLNKAMETLREKATDAMGYDAEKADTLYKHIPFGIRLDRETKKAVGFFYHNLYESVFNLGREKSNYWPRYWSWQANGGDIDLFLIGGGSLRRILDNYTLLTGRPALLPKRALGYQASSMYYPELERDCDRAILDFIDTAREEGFPLDGFHLSSGYTAQGEKRCAFTWNRARFPEPEAFFAGMNEKGAPVAPNVKPGVLLSHPRYEEFRRQGVFLKDSRDPEKPAAGSWWGGEGAFWDFTDPEARDAWKRSLKESVLSMGTASVWNDNCEYDSVQDGDALADADGAGAPIEALRPVMSNLMCKAAAEAVAELDPDARPYIICRSGAPGIQRYAQTWCGDNRTGWESLKYGIPILTGMSLSGQPNEGADIGGFAGPAPDAELFLRWVQNGIFQPRFSIHSANSDNTVTEPWMYSGVKDLVREAMLLRYRLTPYLYSAVWEASQTGAPVMRAPVYEFQEDEGTYDESFTFLFGRDLLVANVLEPGAVSRAVYLPAGCTWYDLNDHYRPYEGGQTVTVPVSPETIPVFLREGAVVPMADNRIMNMERDAVTDLRLILAPGGEARKYTLYDDDGRSNGYLRGEYRCTEIAMGGADTVEVRFRAEGAYPDPVERVAVEMVHRAGSPYRVTLGGRELEHFLNRGCFEQAEAGWYYSQTKRAVLIRYPNPREDTVLKVCFAPHDLIGM